MKIRLALCAAMAMAAFSAGAVRAADAAEQIEKYLELAKTDKGEAEAKKIGEALLKELDKDADNLNEFAWKILTEEGIVKRDLDLGMRVAKAAFDASEGKSAAIVDTYARAFFESGKIEDAIKWQKKAIELCDDDNLKSELEEALKKYEAKAKEKK